ncbi:MAG: hypothetical protein ACLRIT_07770 [Blautia sp.]
MFLVLVQITANIRRPGKFGPTSACRYSTWKCVQCIFKLFVVSILAQGDRDGIQTVTFWLMGSLAGAKWENLAVIIPLRYSNPVFLHPEPYSQYDAAWR